MTDNAKITSGDTGAAPRVALVSPFNDCLSLIPPIQLGYLASTLRNAGLSPRVFDYKLPGANEVVLTKELVAWNPRVVGISAMTIQMPAAITLCRTLKGLLPDAKIIIGGVHATALPQLTLEETGADFVFRKEAENSIAALAAHCCGSHEQPEEIPGAVFLRDGSPVFAPDSVPVMNLDEIPFPAWDLMPPEKYSEFPWQLYKRRQVVAPILTSRGCPHNCSFCAATMMHGRRTRQRSPQNILDEMELLARKFNVGELQIIDDNFTGNKKRTIEICEAMSRRGLGVVWKTPNGIRVDMVDDELISAMKRAGCYETGLGIESASRPVLDLCGKNFDAAEIRNAIKIIRRHGLDVYGFFIFGMPGETQATIKETVDFMVSSGLDHVSLSYCVPYPGSRIYDEFFSPMPGRPQWERFIHFTPFPGLSELSDEQLKRAMKKALLRFYLHPRRALKLLAKIKSTPLSRTSRLLQKYLGKAK